MNSITIAGNLGRDAEMRHMSNGDPVLSFSIGDSPGRDKLTIWWNCSIFGKRAEALAPYLVKGQTVTVAGSVTEREWTDKDGAKRKSMDVRVNEIALQGGKREAAGDTPPTRSAAAKAPNYSTPDHFVDSDIPFAPLPRRALYSF